MDKNIGATTMENVSDFEHLKVWQDNPDIKHYLSENHWNFHVNTAFHRLLSSFYNDEGIGGVGEYVDYSLYPFSQTETIDYNPLYGRMLNEAYRLCNIVLNVPVPEITIPQLFQEAETMNYRNKIFPKGRGPQPSVIEQILSYHIIGMVNVILSLANCHSDAIDRFLYSLSIYQRVGLSYFGEAVRFDYYYKKYEQSVAVALMFSSALRPGYDYKGQDEHLRKTILWYKYIAEELERMKEKVKSKTDEEHGEHYYGKNVVIFHENLDPDKIAKAIISINRNGIGVRHFCLILYKAFRSLNGCLTTTSIPKFLDWVKYNCKIYFKSIDLKKVELSDDEEKKIEEYKAIFAVKQLDEKWIFNKKFYRKDSQNNPLQSIEKIR